MNFGEATGNSEAAWFRMVQRAESGGQKCIEPAHANKWIGPAIMLSAVARKPTPKQHVGLLRKGPRSGRTCAIHQRAAATDIGLSAPCACHRRSRYWCDCLHCGMTKLNQPKSFELMRRPLCVCAGSCPKSLSILRDHGPATSSVQTLKLTSVFGPKVWVIGTSAASRPCAIRMRPMRGMLLRASNVYHRPPR
jgi:hypothetical protein